MFKQLTTSRMCPKSQKIRINHKNTSKIRVFFLKYSYIRVSSYKYERLIHTGLFGNEITLWGPLVVPRQAQKWVIDTDLVNIGQLDHYVVF